MKEKILDMIANEIYFQRNICNDNLRKGKYDSVDLEQRYLESMERLFNEVSDLNDKSIKK